MSIHLNISNSLRALAEELCLELQHQRYSVFQPHYVVTQTEGMNNWLRLQIASSIGITANVIFLSPNEIIQKTYYVLGGKFPNILSPQNLAWLIYSILGEKSFTRSFPQVSSYYDHAGSDRNLKRMALAEKTADLFDQYQVYRPEWIDSWNNKMPVETPGQDWQQHLWSRAKELSRERLPDKTAIGKFISDALKDPINRAKLKAKLPAVHLFGLSIITEYHVALLFDMAKTSDIYFHLVNPAPSVYWFEDRSEKQLAAMIRKGLLDKSEASAGNTLLTSWGRVIQDTFMLLFKNEELLNSFREVELVEPEPGSLLHKVQNDIYNGASREERKPVSLDDVSDGSINISSCYTIAREVEVLYNYLVHLVDLKNEILSPRDIVVMVTDIDAYAPYIRAVFKNAPYRFHFTIADENFSSGDSLVSALTSILEMNRENFKAEEVLQLLDSGHIRRRFGISDLDLVRKLVNAANIRFGMAGKDEDDTRFVSWQYGIKRIMYGICLSGGEKYADPDGETLFPLDLIEGSESQQIIRFCHFVQVLMDSINERDRARTIAEWIEYTERLIQNLVMLPEEEVEEDYALLQAELSNFNIADEFMSEKIDFEIFTHSLVQYVSRAVRSGSFAGGGITFCSLIPMRSIPFKVVALMGLNFDKFPRKETAASFNLMEQGKRRRGDRNVKENDKHLFLDTVLSAQEYLYISYLGQSAKDNTTIPPSALVDELIDYIEDSCNTPEKVRPALVTKHPLHSFSRKYGLSLPGYYNYLDKKGSKNPVTSSGKATAPFDFEEVSLGSFISFFKHPFKSYYNKVLDIYYNDEEVLLSDTEIFNLDSLQKWSLKQQLVTVEPGATDEMIKQLVKTGGLPLRNMAPVAIDALENEISKVREMLKEIVGDEPGEKIPFELTIDNSLLTGTLGNTYNNKMVYVSYSKKENKYLLEAYISYLTAIAAGLNHAMYFISAEREEVFEAVRISKAEALKRLTALMQLYKLGHSEIIAFFIDFKMTPAEVDRIDEMTLDKMLKSFFTNDLFPCTDRYLLNEYQNGFFKAPDIANRYKANAMLLLKPLGEMFPGYF